LVPAQVRLNVGKTKGKAMTNKRMFEYTKHPMLFKKSNWGLIDTSFENSDPQIIANRDLFAEEFNVIKYIGNDSPQSGHQIFDHCELYQCKNEYLYIVSHHGADDSIDKCATENGFVKYKKLYTENSSTYIQSFADKTAFNAFKKNH
jgi:hypothetical protein